MTLHTPIQTITQKYPRKKQIQITLTLSIFGFF